MRQLMVDAKIEVAARAVQGAYLESGWGAMVARIACCMDRIAGVGLVAVFVSLCLEVVAQVTDFDVTVDHEALGHTCAGSFAFCEMSWSGCRFLSVSAGSNRTRS